MKIISIKTENLFLLENLKTAISKEIKETDIFPVINYNDKYYLIDGYKRLFDKKDININIYPINKIISEEELYKELIFNRIYFNNFRKINLKEKYFFYKLKKIYNIKKINFNKNEIQIFEKIENIYKNNIPGFFEKIENISNFKKVINFDNEFIKNLFAKINQNFTISEINKILNLSEIIILKNNQKEIDFTIKDKNNFISHLEELQSKEYYQEIKEAYLYKKKIDTDNIKILFDNNLESETLDIVFKLNDLKELENSFNYINSKREYLKKIFDLLK